MPEPIETWTCALCGTECSRARVKGQRPKWCSQRCAEISKRGVRGTCRNCGVEYHGLGRQFCQKSCDDDYRQRNAKPKPNPPPRLDQRGPIRRAWDDEDWPSILSYLLAKTTPGDGGCLLWLGKKTRDGYPQLRIGRSEVSAHRLSCEAYHGKRLGSQSVHHVCANTACINPTHLQPVTHRENVAEMLARVSYLQRIRDLEDALAAIAPEHPLLGVIELR